MQNKKQKMHVMMAIAFAALMLAMAFVPMIGAEDSSAAYTKDSPQTLDKTIQMKVGDTFTYTPKVNIASGNTTYSTVDTLPTGASWTNNTLTLVPTAAGSYDIMLKADWTSGTADGSDKSVSQTAYLKLSFNVSAGLAIVDTLPVKYLVYGTDSKAGSTVYTFENGSDKQWTGPSGATVGINVYTNATDAQNAQAKNETATTSGGFIWDSASKSVKVGSSDLSEGVYYIGLSLKYDPGYAEADYARTVLTVLVTENIKLINSDNTDFKLIRNLVADTTGSNTDEWSLITNFDKYVGGTDLENKATFTERSITNGNTLAGGTVTITPTTGTSTEVGKPTFKFDASKLYSATASDCTDYVFGVKVTGTYGTASQTLELETDVTYRVYASLRFTELPTVSSNVSVKSTADNPNDVTITTTVSNADYIMVYWGDGTSSKISALDADNVSYTARHVYATQANYLISVVASNDNGATTGMLYYDSANDLIDTTVDNVKTQAKSIIDEHGYLFIILIVVGAIISIVAMIWFPDYRYIAVGLILVAIGVVIFFGGWKLP